MEIFGGTTIGAVIGAAATGVLAKIIDVRGRRQTKQIDIAAELRDDLWAQTQVYEQRLDKCRTECDEWRERYNKARDEYYEMRRIARRYEARFGPLDASDSPRGRPST